MANNPPCNNRGENNQLSIFSRMGFTKPVAHVHQYTAQEVFSLPSFHTALLGLLSAQSDAPIFHFLSLLSSDKGIGTEAFSFRLGLLSSFTER